MFSFSAAAIMLAVLVSAHMLLFSAAEAAECAFTSDCSSLDKCANIENSSCVCKFGECAFDGNPYTQQNQCTDYTDCACSDTKETCFCRDGACKNEAWECHEERDCLGLEKCKDLDCRCSTYNTCEPYECYDETDCLSGPYDCTSYEGFTCSCPNHVCELVAEKEAVVDSKTDTESNSQETSCVTTQDCFNAGHDCVDQYTGWTCKCDDNVCNYTEVEEEYTQNYEDNEEESEKSEEQYNY